METVKIESKHLAHPDIGVDRYEDGYMEIYQGSGLVCVPPAALPALISALQAALPDGGWLPMADAPDDGTDVLVMYQGERVIAHWSRFHGHWVGLNVRHPSGARTVDSLRDGLGNGGPTAWQPLPPPTVSKGDGA